MVNDMAPHNVTGWSVWPPCDCEMGDSFRGDPLTNLDQDTTELLGSV